MWIKICGNTTLEDAELAVKHGADAVGFVFARSPRRMMPEAVSQITKKLPPEMEKYGVFVSADFSRIVETVRVAGLTGVQLHSKRRTGLARQLREHFSRFENETRRFSILQVLHFDTEMARFQMQLSSLGRDVALDAVLVDSRVGNKPGGTGVAFDWKVARESFAREAGHLRLVAAGGLGPDNVESAIEILQPWGVDVVSGVEARPGKKDPARVQAFIGAAKKAAVSR